MDLFTAALLLGAGVLAGLLASIIGGAAVVVYPAMIMAGVPPQAAAVSNLVAIMPATMLAALSDRSQLPPFNRAFSRLIFASVLGAGAGAALLLATPERLFNVVIPLLLGLPRCCSLLPKRSAPRCAPAPPGAATISPSTSRA